eukprot:jgi/Mesvir1/14185/Mv09642-RA.1
MASVCSPHPVHIVLGNLSKCKEVFRVRKPITACPQRFAKTICQSQGFDALRGPGGSDAPKLAAELPHDEEGFVDVSKSNVSWDPEGILSQPISGGGLIAARERRRQQQVQHGAGVESTTLTRPLKQVTTSKAVRDLSTAQDGYDAASLRTQLLDKDFMPVNLEGYPGLRVMHLDPPVFLVDGFIPDDACDRVVAAMEQSNALRASQIGDYTVGSSQNAVNFRRTSSSVMLDDRLALLHPELAQFSTYYQEKIQELLPLDAARWAPRGQLPGPGKFCFELTQFARYQRGEHFLSHEDAFPLPVAVTKGFQRRATVLLYLNDVPEGGCTSFDLLPSLAPVRPNKGSVLLFFPAFSSGAPDSRTLHTAEGAVDTKYVIQQWVAWGMPQGAGGGMQPRVVPGASAVAQGAGSPQGFGGASKAAKKGRKPRK